jgi:hypothetical protein
MPALREAGGRRAEKRKRKREILRRIKSIFLRMTVERKEAAHLSPHVKNLGSEDPSYID